MAQPFSLLALPDELLLGILSCLSAEQSALSAVACACRRLQNLAEDFIYASNLIIKGSQAQRLSHALTARKDRVRLVHSLDLRCRFAHAAGMSVMNTLLPGLVNLKELTIESPWCNHSAVSTEVWDDALESYAQTFRDASLLANSYEARPNQPLARLQSCTLHLSGAQTRLWPLNQAAALFLHPSLRELTISCADGHEANIDIPFETYRGSTLLQQLTFIECDISVATMESILSLPSALQSLDITSCRSLHRSWNKTSLVHLIRILVAHQPNLESLTYANTRESENSEIDLSLLNKLKYLALPCDNGRRSQHFDTLIRNIRPSQGFASLETVSIGVEWEGKANSVLSYHRKLGLQSSQCPQLRTLVVALGGFEDMYNETEEFENERDSFVEAFKKRLLGDFKGRQVRIILQATIHHHYVPPYLFRERAPERQTIFDFSANEPLASSNR
ncbi:MAG: hypothetical protein Q9195_007382 [Heterodermia aff. obscurata]